MAKYTVIYKLPYQLEADDAPITAETVELQPGELDHLNNSKFLIATDPESGTAIYIAVDEIKLIEEEREEEKKAAPTKKVSVSMGTK